MAMTLSEIAEDMLIKSGQFVLGDLNSVGFNMTRFWALAKPVLATYETFKGKPYSKQITQPITTLFPAPTIINSVIPAIVPALAGNTFDAGVLPFTYDQYTGKLTVSSLVFPLEATGITGYNYTVTYKTPSTVEVIDVDFPTLSFHDEEFLTLLQGRFLQTLGLSRRAFTLTELQIDMDAAELVQEGRDLYQEAYNTLAESTNDWHMSIKL